MGGVVRSLMPTDWFGRTALAVAGSLGAGGVAAAAAASHAGDERILGALALVALTHAPAVLALSRTAVRGWLMRAATALIGLGALVFCGDHRRPPFHRRGPRADVGAVRRRSDDRRLVLPRLGGGDRPPLSRRVLSSSDPTLQSQDGERAMFPFGDLYFPGAGGNWQEFMTRVLSPSIAVNFAGNSAIEREVVADVASYGRQIGWLNDIVAALTDATPDAIGADPAAADSLAKLKAARERIAAIKERRAASAVDDARDALKRLGKTDRDAYARLVRSLDPDRPLAGT